MAACRQAPGKAAGSCSVDDLAGICALRLPPLLARSMTSALSTSERVLINTDVGLPLLPLLAMGLPGWPYHVGLVEGGIAEGGRGGEEEAAAEEITRLKAYAFRAQALAQGDSPEARELERQEHLPHGGVEGAVVRDEAQEAMETKDVLTPEVCSGGRGAGCCGECNWPGHAACAHTCAFLQVREAH